MAAPLRLVHSRTYPVVADRAFADTLALPLDQLFSRRFGPIPPITGTDPAGDWGTVGQERTIRTADGGTMRERLVRVDPPEVFAYEIGDITGPMKPLIERVEGSWAFEPAGTGTRITWTWDVWPRGALGRAIGPVFAKLWRGYAARGFQRLEDLLV